MAPRRGVPARVQEAHFPAPTGGLNTVSPGLEMPLTDCVAAYNLVGAENGLRTRLGYREMSVGLVGNAANAVRTILPFTGSTNGQSRIFATTDKGIYDVTTGAPTLQVTFPNSVGQSGYGIPVNFVSAAGHFLIYTDEANGMYVYAEAGSAWTRVSFGGGAQGVAVGDPTRFAFVALFKGRLWFAERDSSDAWYLPLGQLYGTATKFPLGQVFREGGSLVGLWNWTYDGGSGLDDSLVMVSTGGDVVVYQGTDPSSVSTFGLKGVWQMSRPPSGRRIASTYGGDLLLLSRRGLLPMSQLVVGSLSSAEYATAKIANIINTFMQERSTDPYWGVVLQPEDNVLMLLVPQGASATSTQLVQSNAGRGWFLYRDLPVLSGAVWQGQFYFGTLDGRVCVHTGYADNVTLALPQSYAPVDWGFVGAFSNLGSTRQKRVSILRPLIISDGVAPSYAIAARYDYDAAELSPVELVLMPTANAWNTAKWNISTWSGKMPPAALPGGGLGIGTSMAVTIRGQSLSRTIVVGVDVAYQVGGFL